MADDTIPLVTEQDGLGSVSAVTACASIVTADSVDSVVRSQLEEALALLPDGVLLIDRQWRLVYANQRARAISRLRMEDLNGPTHWELYPATVGTEVESRYRRAMEERIASEFVYFYKPFQVWFKVRVLPAGDGIAVHYADVTRLHEVEAERDEATAQVRQILSATTDAVFALDPEWKITFVNEAGRRMAAPVGDVLGRNLWNIFPNLVDERSDFVRVYYRAMVERVPGSLNAFYPDPLNIWMHVEAQPFEGGMVLFVRDVTQQRRDEAALRESEEKYRVLAELGPQAIWTGLPDGRINYANQRILEYLGKQLTPEWETEWIQAFVEEDRHRVLQAWSHAVATGEVYDLQARMVRAFDGAARWWRLQARPLRDESGAITTWLGVADEIHEQVMTAERLQQERAETERQRGELEVVYDTAPIGLALFEPDEFRYLRVNRQQAETLGMPVTDLLGKRIDEVVTSPEVLKLFRKVREGETIRNHTYETQLTGKPGETRSFHVNYSPVFTESGEVRAISAAVLEITKQQKAERALLQSEKLAAVGRLASSISHEINNPLEAVTNLLFLAEQDEGLTEDGRSYVRMAQDELTRMSQIATQTLRFHRQSNSPIRVTAAQLVDPVLNLYQGRLVNSRIHVEASYSTARKILCFENDIRQVLNNLIANAIDAMRNGGRLIIRAHNQCDLRSGAEGVRISVADTGHGMDEATLRRVFEPFYTTKDLNGNGLGLWISQGIMERHQGQLRVHSTQHRTRHGTVFSLFLPSSDHPLPSR